MTEQQTRPTTDNRFADELRQHISEEHGGCAWAEAGRDGLLDAALREQTRITVDRIRSAFVIHEYSCHECDNAPNLHRILDEVAALPRTPGEDR